VASLFQNLMNRLFGPPEPIDDLPDDGGLAEFAKQYAAQLAEEKKHGKKPGVTGDDVLHVQQGRHGARAYLLDTTDFRNAIVRELRPSVAPVTEGILKSRCGDKGSGYMHVGALYVFHLPPGDAVEEYNSALAIIDEIGARLLGERYITGERKLAVPAARVLPQDIINEDGSFNAAKAQQAIKLVRAQKTKGPQDVEWQKDGRPRLAAPPPQWVENTIEKHPSQQGDWQKQDTPAKDKKSTGTWQTIPKTKAPPTPANDTTSPPPAETAQNWQNQPSEKQKATTARSWETTPTPSSLNPVEVQAAPSSTPPSKHPLQTLDELGDVFVGYRPTWCREHEAITCFTVFAFRRVAGNVLKGDMLYPAQGDSADIQRLDQAIGEQVAHHLRQAKQLEEKTIILPVHLLSLSADKKHSPLTPLRDLDENIRRSIWIEAIELESAGSAQSLEAHFKKHQDKFQTFGLRFDPDNIRRPLTQTPSAGFLSCDFDAGALPMRRTTDVVNELAAMAHNAHKQFCVWGLDKKSDITRALQENCAFLNGHALARDMRKPGKVIPLPASKLLMG